MTDYTIPAMIAAIIMCASCSASPAADPQAVRLDDVSAAAYQAGRTQQAAQTADAGNATAYARADAWTVTAAARTEIVAVAAATLRAGEDQATARALTPTMTPIPTDTPAPTPTPRPTWTQTPDATVAALRVEQATADRDAAIARGWVGTGLLITILLAVIGAAVIAGIRAWIWLDSKWSDARRKQHLSAGPYYDMASGQIVGLLPEPAAPMGAPEPPPTDAQTAEAARQWGWRTAVLQIAMYATEADSWAYTALGPAGWGVVSRPGWDALTEYLSECGVIVKRPQSPTRWADGVTAQTLAELVRGRGLPRAYPPGPAPVLSAPRGTGAQSAQRAQAA